MPCFTVCALFCTFVSISARAADPDAWRHPDPRFAPIDDAVDGDDYAGAQQLLAELRTEAKRGQDQALLAEALEEGKEVTKLARDFNKIAKHLKVLEKNPKEPKASLAAGKYYLLRDKWLRALPLLSAGDDAKLAALAVEDSRVVLQRDGQAEIADRWWQYSLKVSDADERIAYQLRAREWMLNARRGADDKARAIIDQRLKQVPLFIDRIVVWNMHNGGYNDRGSEELLVSLLYQEKVVWKDAVEIPWVANKPAYVMLRPKHVRADQIRVDVTKPYNGRAGLGEIEVVVGRKNIARQCEPVADSYFEFNDAYRPSLLVDGDTSGNTGFWAAKDGENRWASIHFAEFPSLK
jgi:tetratricopeptide (TPR) repeat protein